MREVSNSVLEGLKQDEFHEFHPRLQNNPFTLIFPIPHQRKGAGGDRLEFETQMKLGVVLF